MKYYQCKNEKYYIYPLIIFYIILGVFAIIYSPRGVNESVVFRIIFIIIGFVAGAVSPIYFIVSKKFNRTVMITEEGIIYQSKTRTAEMKWEEVGIVCLGGGFFSIPFNKVVYFTARGLSPSWNKPRITNKRIWSEFNDEMLDEIKKYWHGDIINEDIYQKYKETLNRRTSRTEK